MAKKEREFGGAAGVFGIMVASHLLVYYLWIALTYYHGQPPLPAGWADLAPYFGRMWDHIATGAAPSWRALAMYGGFFGLQLVFAYVLPGVWVKGLPVPSENNVQHPYLANGMASWYATLALGALLHVTGIFPLTAWADNLGPVQTVGVIAADLLAIATYVVTVAEKKQIRMTGNVVYDFFMGAVLNPRIGRVDLKFFTEIRISWLLLFLLTLSAAVKQYETLGTLTAPMVFMLTAHGLYTNACMKGEECIPYTWDIFYEKWGWMLIFWNLVGVPWVYSFNSYFLLVNQPITHSTLYMVLLFLVLGFAYYVWDTAQSQRNRFRMQERGTYIPRHTFPQLPWGTLSHPKFLTTRAGTPLLIDGWWAYARKIHYTADVTMALTWALACGFHGVLPFLYPTFFLVMILHRAGRDERRCERKYGDDWKRYLAIVKYRFIPFVY